MAAAAITHPMKSRAFVFPVFALLFAILSGCATEEQSIVPVPLRSNIGILYVVENPDAGVDALLPELIGQLSAMGFDVMVAKDGEVPEDDYSVVYQTRLSGQSVKSLSYLRISVKKGNRVVGYAFSDAHGSLSRFGSTGEKLKPLLDGLFEYAKPRRK